MGKSPANRAGSADFRLLFQAAPGMYLALDPKLSIVAVSDAYAQGTHTRPADLIGKAVWEAIPDDPGDQPPGTAACLRASLDRVRRDRVADTMDVQKRSIPGAGSQGGGFEVRYWRPANVPVLGPDGKLWYIIHWVDEITGHTRELAEAQQAQRAAGTAKAEFVSRVSHELRSPINTILGFGELLSLGELTAENREWAAMMLKAARQVASFMDNVVDISRAQARKLSMSIEAVPARSVIADALELIRPLAASYGVHLDPPPQTSAYVQADQQRLRQVLLNLLSNAVKYNHPAGKVTITVGRLPGSLLRINIADTGRGIADYDIGQLFAPFQRLDAALAGVEGAGLGLTLSRQLIEAMGGTVGATSEPGEGSMFWVELPITQPAADSPPVSETDPLMQPRAYTTPKTVLYVEDMVETLRLVEHILKRRPSTRVVPAMLGAVALDLAAEHHPHLILLDLNLPDMPGDELLHRLKSDPATSATPVVIISADATQERIDRLLTAGATTYLTKPISVRGFLRTIDTLLAPPEPPQAEAAGRGGTGVARTQPGPAIQADGRLSPAVAALAAAAPASSAGILTAPGSRQVWALSVRNVVHSSGVASPAGVDEEAVAWLAGAYPGGLRSTSAAHYPARPGARGRVTPGQISGWTRRHRPP